MDMDDANLFIKLSQSDADEHRSKVWLARSFPQLSGLRRAEAGHESFFSQ